MRSTAFATLFVVIAILPATASADESLRVAERVTLERVLDGVALLPPKLDRHISDDLRHLNWSATFANVPVQQVLREREKGHR